MPAVASSNSPNEVVDWRQGSRCDVGVESERVKRGSNWWSLGRDCVQSARVCLMTKFAVVCKQGTVRDGWDNEAGKVGRMGAVEVVLRYLSLEVERRTWTWTG